MKPTYQVKVISFNEIHELPSSWIDKDFNEVLEHTGFDDSDQIDPGELKDYVIMALQELDPDEAAEIVLNHKLGNRLSKGQIQNLAHEMMDEKLWEEYTDINLHKGLYDCAVLLKWAFPNVFPETDAARCVIEVKTNAPESLTSPSKTFLTRLLSKGMNDHALINRLFEDQVQGATFPEADGIIWQFESNQELDKTMLTIYSSLYWLHAMDEINQYTTSAIPI